MKAPGDYGHTSGRQPIRPVVVVFTRRTIVRRVLCGVPASYCKGAQLLVDKRYMPVHATHSEAFECYAAWLISQGYRRIGSREFRLGDGPVLVLTKKIRFGAPLRLGKRGEKASGSRFTYKKKGKSHSHGGTIIPT